MVEETKKRFKSRLPVIKIIPEEKEKKSKPQHDPFFYISKGKTNKIALALPPGLGLPKRGDQLVRSCNKLKSIRQLNRHRSLELLSEPIPPKRKFLLKNLEPLVKHPQSSRLLTPSFRSFGVKSAQDHLPEATFKIEKW